MKEPSVSDVVQITGLSRTTLLYYEAKGLIRPIQSQAADHQKYTMDDISQIMFYHSVGPLGNMDLIVFCLT